MSVVHHYPLNVGERFAEEVQAGTTILSVMMRDGQPTLYVEKPTVGSVKFPDQVLYAEVHGTGHDFETMLDYIGTVTDRGMFWHVYGRVI